MTAIDWRAPRYGWGLWVLFLLAVTVVIGIQPVGRTMVTLAYRDASTHWWAHQDLYTEGPHGFLYFPQSAILFTPLTWLPFGVGEVVWRWISVVPLAWAVWRLSRLADPDRDVGLFSLVTLLTIPTAIASARVGQANLLLAALMVHATVDLARHRWWVAVASLSFMLALKPLGFEMLLLVVALYRPMRWRLAVGVAAVVVLPFLFGEAGYVLDQYRLSVVKLHVASRPDSDRFADLTGVLRSMGGHPSEGLLTVVRLAAAGGTVALGRRAARRWGEPRASILMLALAAAYLMLCNPRTQENSYVILGPVVALFAAQALLGVRRSWAASVLLPVAVALGFNRSFTVHPNYWLQPAVTLVFVAYLVYVVLANQPWPSPCGGGGSRARLKPDFPSGATEQTASGAVADSTPCFPTLGSRGETDGRT